MEKGKIKTDMARRLIDMVIGKGETANLKRIRSGFVGKVGLPALKGLLDDLWQHKVLSTDDKDTVLEDHTSRTDRARCLIDMVMAKGERASLAMIDCMLERDRELYLTLGLILPPSPTDRVDLT
uniref:CARD domain-containing protein n=1 Tax=Gadus morhua TaxID=8049 RepID=A0A8C5FX08_GADMO